jgi:hypothetical protein
MDIEFWRSEEGIEPRNTMRAKIDANRSLVIEELYSWAWTFDSNKAYKSVRNLAKRLETGLCSEEDYLDIIFHIWQMDYNFHESGDEEERRVRLWV